MRLVGGQLVCSLHFLGVFESLGLSSIVFFRGWSRTVGWKLHHADTIISIGTISASPGGLYMVSGVQWSYIQKVAYRVKSDHSGEFYEAMEIAKQDVKWYESDILWISSVVTPELHSLTEHKCPYQQECEQCPDIFR